jgi:hypothetical protein
MCSHHLDKHCRIHLNGPCRSEDQGDGIGHGGNRSRVDSHPTDWKVGGGREQVESSRLPQLAELTQLYCLLLWEVLLNMEPKTRSLEERKQTAYSCAKAPYKLNTYNVALHMHEQTRARFCTRARWINQDITLAQLFASTARSRTLAARQHFFTHLAIGSEHVGHQEHLDHHGHTPTSRLS